MNRYLLVALLTSISGLALADDVSVSIRVGQPGFYGQIDIGSTPPPVIYAQPVVVLPAPELAEAPPLYLHVPPGHEKHWNKHCAEYNACGRRVLFVRHDWYENEYVPRHRHEDDRERGRGDDHDRGRDREHGHDRDHEGKHERENNDR